jgi:hypothetical protein
MFLINIEGVTPESFLNTVLKLDIELNPESLAMASMEYLVPILGSDNIFMA